MRSCLKLIVIFTDHDRDGAPWQLQETLVEISGKPLFVCLKLLRDKDRVFSK